MTTVYFIRHAESDISVRHGRTRPLTAKGLADRMLVTEFLSDKGVDAVLSSPFKRAADTVADFAEKSGFEIELVEDFRERKSDSDWDREADFHTFIERQWADFLYSLSDGECLADVQARNIAALNGVLTKYKDKTIAIGTHGTALSTIINYYDDTYGYDDFNAMAGIMPWVVKMYFDGIECAGMAKIDLFRLGDKPDYTQPRVCTYDLGALKAYRFVVIFARYRDRWLYCRAKGRDIYETAGGHIEQGESPLEAAKRELYEETGAVKYTIEPAFDYSVHIPTEYSNGQVLFARIEELGEIPDYEEAIGGVETFATIPGEMRFPKILPALYEKMQGWVNVQSNKDELWDVYDSSRQLTGRTHRRADPLPVGDFHLAVHAWLQNSKGEFLITKRSPNKGDPNMWECTAGSAIVGDDSISAVVREVKEETGLDVKPKNGKCIMTLQREDRFVDVWLFRQDFDLRDVVLQPDETTEAKYASIGDIREMIKKDEFIAYRYMDDFFHKLKRSPHYDP